MSFLNPPSVFGRTSAWWTQKQNALQYNTSMAGSVVQLVYGTTRIPVNLIDFANYRGPRGKKGKVGPLPTTGAPTGKGGGGGKKSKKSADFSVDVAFGFAQGPCDGVLPTNAVYASGSTTTGNKAGLNAYSGVDGQAPDPTFAGIHGAFAVGYSGTWYATGTPMNLGSSPVLPNLSAEFTGMFAGTAGTSLAAADPSLVVVDFLSNARYGLGFPSANIDPNIQPIYGDYCISNYLVVSLALDSQTKAADWLEGLAKLTNSAIVWSGTILKFIPYGDLPTTGGGVTWTPNLVPAYSFVDDDFLPWHPHQDGSGPQAGEDDPIIITRTNPADAINWLTIEYLDANNFYNPNVLPVFDQDLIDQYGLRTGENLQGHCFTYPGFARNSAQLALQRLAYIRNTYKFQVGWQFSLLEPMDIVLLTEAVSGLNQQPVRVTAIEENDNGDLTVTAEQIESQIWPGPPAILPFIGYSVRLINPAYTGPLYRLRRDSDNATMDFYPDPTTGNSPTAAIVTWLAGANGWFDTWYDQGPYAAHIHNASHPGQPQWSASANAGWPGASFIVGNGLTSGLFGSPPPLTNGMASYAVLSMPISSSWPTLSGNQVNEFLEVKNGTCTTFPIVFLDGPTAGFGSVPFTGVSSFWGETTVGYQVLDESGLSFDTSFHLWDGFMSNVGGSDLAQDSVQLSPALHIINSPGPQESFAQVTIGALGAQFIGVVQEVRIYVAGGTRAVLGQRGAIRADMINYYVLP